MKIWKKILIAATIAILPFALVGIGQAQQLTCWGLRPNLPEKTDFASYYGQTSQKECEDIAKDQNSVGSVLQKADAEESEDEEQQLPD